MDPDGPAIGGASSLSPTSPTSVRSLGALGHHANGGFKRKRSSIGGVKAESSPDSGLDEHDDDHPDRKRQPGVKRACVSHRGAMRRESQVVPLTDQLVTERVQTAEAQVRCCPRTIRELLALQASQARLQDRVELQACREA
jgi:hypothetical protein